MAHSEALTDELEERGIEGLWEDVDGDIEVETDGEDPRAVDAVEALEHDLGQER